MAGGGNLRKERPQTGNRNYSGNGVTGAHQQKKGQDLVAPKVTLIKHPSQTPPWQEAALAPSCSVKQQIDCRMELAFVPPPQIHFRDLQWNSYFSHPYFSQPCSLRSCQACLVSDGLVTNVDLLEEESGCFHLDSCKPGEG